MGWVQKQGVGGVHAREVAGKRCGAVCGAVRWKGLRRRALRDGGWGGCQWLGGGAVYGRSRAGGGTVVRNGMPKKILQKSLSFIILKKTQYWR